MAEPYRVWGSLEGIDEMYTKWFDHVVPSIGTHAAAKLNLLALAIREVAAPDDVILFMDGDAFPIADPMPVIRAALNESVLVAVRRDENAGDPQPHPSFCATKVESWDELHGDWSKGYPWAANPKSGRPVSDVGGNLLFAASVEEYAMDPTDEVKLAATFTRCGQASTAGSCLARERASVHGR